MAWPYVLFAFAAGIALPVQFGINSQLAAWLDSPVRAAFVSFLTGLVFGLYPATTAARLAPVDALHYE